MNCEICGLSDKKFYKVEIEGSVFIACISCAKNGKILSEIGENKEEHAHNNEATIEDLYGGDVDFNLSNKLKEAIRSKNMSIEELSKETKTPVDELNKVINGKLVPRIDLTRKLEKALKIKLSGE
ncbi:helix-turn-helix domain-containing protein [Candidatus Parvarchaeota archaeon]|nr:helix-turn-helix domain-containing protein [Candidatus Acidifodinimicrobium mancum]MBE5729976.1 helix-turn-helix domain-containing protein [Candidatus Acidifodinimicrobium mancum]